MFIKYLISFILGYQVLILHKSNDLLEQVIFYINISFILDVINAKNEFEHRPMFYQNYQVFEKNNDISTCQKEEFINEIGLNHKKYDKIILIINFAEQPVYK